MGFPVEMFPVLFAIPRTAGWIAQWEEMLHDPEQKIARPRQIYIGSPTERLRPPRAAQVVQHRDTEDTEAFIEKAKNFSSEKSSLCAPCFCGNSAYSARNVRSGRVASRDVRGR